MNRTSMNISENGTANILSLTYTYDVLNRLTGVTNGNETTSYTYDANSNLLSETTGTSRIVEYTYNKANLVKTHAIWGRAIFGTFQDYIREKR